MSERRTAGLDLGDASLLRAEAEEALGAEPRLLSDAAFLGGIHARLRAGLAPDTAAGTLLRAGFRQGLRDALEALEGEPAAVGRVSPPRATRVPIRLDVPPRPTPRGLDARGGWPVALEATGCRRSGLSDGHLGCVASAGYTSGWLSGLWGGDYLADETHCALRGDADCRFRVRAAGAWPRSAARARRALDALPFAALRGVVADARSAAATPAEPDRFDPDAPVIHVWGPVMVVPFSGADESVHGVELIGRDTGARDVRVVVVDLTGAVLDPGFGALALERVLDAIRGWGAEPILSGVGPLSQPVVDDLDREPLLVEKDLAQAIAVAFRVADAQRRPA